MDSLGEGTTATTSVATTGGRKQGRVAWDVHRRTRVHALVWGVMSGALLVLVYIAVLALANSLEHATGEFLRLWYWMVPIIVGFSVQVGLFAYGHRASRSKADSHAGGVLASGSASTLSMVACCAHHLTDVLPLIGLSGAAFFLGTYQHLFLLLGLLSNIVGLVYVLSTLSKSGLYPDRSCLLASIFRLPVERAFPFVLAAAIAVFSISVFLEFT